MRSFFRAIFGLLLIAGCVVGFLWFFQQKRNPGSEFSITRSAKSLIEVEKPAPQIRTWTAKAGSKIEAQLINYTTFDVTLQLPSGASRTVGLAQLSPTDQSYLSEFPDLKSNKASQFRPKVRVSATSAKSAFDSKTTSKEQMTITISNSESYELKNAEIYWVWVAGSRTFYKAEQATVDLPSQKIISIKTLETKPPKGAQTSNFGSTLLVQVRYKGSLIASFTTQGSFNEMAADNGLRSKSRPTKVKPERIQDSLGAGSSALQRNK